MEKATLEKETLDQNHTDKDIISESATDVNNEGHTDDSSSHEKNPDAIATKAEAATIQEHEYVSGIKLALVLASVTLVSFLMLLDIAIIVTVSLGSIDSKS